MGRADRSSLAADLAAYLGSIPGRAAVLCTLLPLCGCGGNDQPTTAKNWQTVTPAPLPDSSALISNGGAYELRWLAEPGEVPLNEPFALRLQVQSGPTPVTALHVDAIMPAHRHGMLRTPRILELGGDGAGEYRIEGMLFHMTGLWELHFDLTCGAVTERAQVDILLE